MFANNRIATRIFAQGFLIVVCFVLAFAWVYWTARQDLYESRKRGTRQVVEVGHGILASYAAQAREGSLPPQEAKRRAVAALRVMRYNGSGSFWIADLEPRMLMDPARPDLEGKPLADYVDSAGRKPFRLAVDACRKAGDGFVADSRNAPPAAGNRSRISYVKLFPEWGWIIGSAVDVADIDARLARFRAIGFGGGLAVLAICVALSCLLGRSVTRGISSFVARAQVAAAGDGRTRIPEEGLEEIRELARAFNAAGDQAQKRVADLSERVRNTGSRIDELSSRILSWIQGVSGAARHSASVTDLTATMEELTRSSREIWSNAESVKEAAAQTVEMAQQGTILVQESVETIAQMQGRVSDIVQKNLFLAEKSQEIGKVLDIIRDVARETHMLALNAALEASIAGEHGRRFGAVATEVRRLSEKTRQSIDAVTSVISQVRAAIDTSVKASEQGIRDAERSREAINLSADAFNEIIEMIERTSRASTQISESTHRQSSANEQAVQTMRQVSEAIRAITADVEEFAASARALKAEIETLRNPGGLA